MILKIMCAVTACVTVMLRRVVQRNDWRVLLVLFIIMAVLAGPFITSLSFVLTLAVFAVYDKESHAEIRKEFRELYDDRMKKF